MSYTHVWLPKLLAMLQKFFDNIVIVSVVTSDIARFENWQGTRLEPIILFKIAYYAVEQHPKILPIMLQIMPA